MRHPPSVLLRLSLAAALLALTGCGGAPEPAPAQPVGRNAPSQAADMRLGELRIEARLVRAADLGEAMATRYGLPRDADAWVLLVSPRDAEGNGVSLDGLEIQRPAGFRRRHPRTRTGHTADRHRRQARRGPCQHGLHPRTAAALKPALRRDSAPSPARCERFPPRPRSTPPAPAAGSPAT